MFTNKRTTTNYTTTLKETQATPVLSIRETSRNSHWYTAKVQSSRFAHIRYDVTVDARSAKMRSSCNCPAGSMKRLCRHQKAVIAAVQELQDRADRWVAYQTKRILGDVISVEAVEARFPVRKEVA